MKKPYRIGDWFALPLTGGGRAIGRIARARRGIVLGYFFGPPRESLPQLEELEALNPANAVWVTVFGDRGLTTRRWSVLGHDDATWDAAAWPMPDFGNRVSNVCWRVRYPDDDPSDKGKITRISLEECLELWEDGMANDGFVEGALSLILSGNRSAKQHDLPKKWTPESNGQL